MSQFEKTIQRWRRNQKNVRFEEIDSVLLRVGCEKRMRDSHAIYRLGVDMAIVPFHRPFVLPIYVLNALELLEKAGIIAGEVE